MLIAAAIVACYRKQVVASAFASHTVQIETLDFLFCLYVALPATVASVIRFHGLFENLLV